MINQQHRYSTLSYEMYMCLCPVCLGQFFETEGYVIIRNDRYQAKEKCDFCNHRFGYDYRTLPKAHVCSGIGKGKSGYEKV